MAIVLYACGLRPDAHVGPVDWSASERNRGLTAQGEPTTTRGTPPATPQESEADDPVIDWSYEEERQAIAEMDRQEAEAKKLQTASFSPQTTTTANDSGWNLPPDPGNTTTWSVVENNTLFGLCIGGGYGTTKEQCERFYGKFMALNPSVTNPNVILAGANYTVPMPPSGRLIVSRPVRAASASRTATISASSDQSGQIADLEVKIRELEAMNKRRDETIAARDARIRELEADAPPAPEEQKIDWIQIRREGRLQNNMILEAAELRTPNWLLRGFFWLIVAALLAILVIAERRHRGRVLWWRAEDQEALSKSLGAAQQENRRLQGVIDSQREKIDELGDKLLKEERANRESEQGLINQIGALEGVIKSNTLYLNVNGDSRLKHKDPPRRRHHVSADPVFTARNGKPTWGCREQKGRKPVPPIEVHQENFQDHVEGCYFCRTVTDTELALPPDIPADEPSGELPVLTSAHH